MCFARISYPANIRVNVNINPNAGEIAKDFFPSILRYEINTALETSNMAPRYLDKLKLSPRNMKASGRTKIGPTYTKEITLEASSTAIALKYKTKDEKRTKAASSVSIDQGKLKEIGVSKNSKNGIGTVVKAVRS